MGRFSLSRAPLSKEERPPEPAAAPAPAPMAAKPPPEPKRAEPKAAPPRSKHLDMKLKLHARLIE